MEWICKNVAAAVTLTTDYAILFLHGMDLQGRCGRSDADDGLRNFIFADGMKQSVPNTRRLNLTVEVFLSQSTTNQTKAI